MPNTTRPAPEKQGLADTAATRTGQMHPAFAPGAPGLAAGRMATLFGALMLAGAAASAGTDMALHGDKLADLGAPGQGASHSVIQAEAPGEAQEKRDMTPLALDALPAAPPKWEALSQDFKYKHRYLMTGF